MIKDYIYTIGKYLPSSQRKDVLKEIEANIYDYLEEHYGKREYASEEYEAAIRKMGHPKKVAEAYMNGTRCLIGPAYIDTYWLVIKIAVVGSIIGLVVANILTFNTLEEGLGSLFGLLGSVWQTSLSVIGSVTLIFFAINRYSPADENLNEEHWALSELDKAPEQNDRVSMGELIIETIFICVVLFIINHSGIKLGLNFEGVVIVPIINMSRFASYIPWINILLGSTLILNLYLLVKRRWEITSRSICVIVDVTAVAIITLLLYSPGMWDVSAIADALNSDMDNGMKWLRMTVNIGFAVFTIINGIEVYGHLKSICTKRTA